ncbi:MAG: 30S ribosomal protein S17 [Candidatus Pacearchaeota archaeon]
MKLSEISLRKKAFKGEVKKKVGDRVTIEFDRFIYLKKYERYEKRKTKLHAKIPEELKDQVNVGDYVEIRECRPISKMIHFIVTKKIRDKNESSNSESN